MSIARQDPPAMDMKQFEGAFLEEAAEHLADLERLLVRIDIAAPENDELDAIFRAAHSLKGGSGMFGFHDMSKLTHNLESLLDKVRKRELPLKLGMIDLLLESSDLLRSQLAQYGGTPGAVVVPIDEICGRIRQWSESGAAGTAAPGLATAADPVALPRTLHIAFPTDEAVEKLLPDLLDQLGQMGTLEVDPPAAAPAGKTKKRGKQPAAPAQRTLRLTTDSSQDIVLTLFDFVMDASQVTIVAAAAPDEVHVAALHNVHVAALHDNGAPLSSAGDENVGYGFFHAIDAPVVATGHAATHSSVQVAAAATAAASAAPGRANERTAAADTSIRVSVEKVDQLINQVGELVITQAMLSQSAARLDPVLHEKLLAGMADLERNTRELQDSVMSIRMLPVAFVFNRFPRLVRDLAAKLGKEVRFVTHGEGTELDKGLIEKISDPLTHLVRNAIDHGIEMPAQRTAAGKAAHGTITLRAGHQGGNIVIHISDDGAGLDRARIIAKARERGIAVADGISDAEVWKLIFAAGFSTAQEVTDISGRGVGMDVVRRNIDGLGGSVEIDSVSGIGMRVTVRLPLTLAIMDGMSVAVGGEVYVLPLASIVESMHVAESQVRSIVGGGLVINVRGEYMPVVSLQQLFVDGSAPCDTASGTMVIVEAEGAKTALMVDELLGQQQVVVKSLDANYRKVHGLSGATIMGDGRVALILDVATLTRGRRARTGAAAVSMH
ncbi:MAG: chemotaxis protein CheW [Betaproteobacteria bacterium]